MGNSISCFDPVREHPPYSWPKDHPDRAAAIAELKRKRRNQKIVGTQGTAHSVPRTDATPAPPEQQIPVEEKTDEVKPDATPVEETKPDKGMEHVFESKDDDKDVADQVTPASLTDAKEDAVEEVKDDAEMAVDEVKEEVTDQAEEADRALPVVAPVDDEEKPKDEDTTTEDLQETIESNADEVTPVAETNEDDITPVPALAPSVPVDEVEKDEKDEGESAEMEGESAEVEGESAKMEEQAKDTDVPAVVPVPITAADEKKLDEEEAAAAAAAAEETMEEEDPAEPVAPVTPVATVKDEEEKADEEEEKTDEEEATEEFVDASAGGPVSESVPETATASIDTRRAMFEQTTNDDELPEPKELKRDVHDPVTGEYITLIEYRSRQKDRAQGVVKEKIENFEAVDDKLAKEKAELAAIEAVRTETSVSTAWTYKTKGGSAHSSPINTKPLPTTEEVVPPPMEGDIGSTTVTTEEKIDAVTDSVTTAPAPVDVADVEVEDVEETPAPVAA